MARYRSQRHLIVRLIAGMSILLLPLIVAACSGRTDAAVRFDGTMRDSAGVVLVENHGTPMWREGDVWTFTRRLRIGVADGDSTCMFGRLTGNVTLSDGRVVVGDAQYHNVRFFSPEGVHLSTQGREGAGPGEYGGFIDLLLGPGDTILAVDRRNRRANVVSPDGKWLGSFPTAPSKGYWIASWDDDETTSQIVSLMRPIRGEVAPEDNRFQLLIRRDFQGAFLDTLAWLPTTAFVTGEGDAQLVHLYRGESHYDLCDGMIVTGHSDEFRLVWQRPDGTVERIVKLDREPLAFTEEDQATLHRRIDAMAQETGVTREEAAEFKSRFRYESTYPAYRQLLCGPAGTLLVQRIRPLRELSEEELPSSWLWRVPLGADEWDVFDREGRYLGVAPLPIPPHRHAFTRDPSGAWLMSGLERGEFDVPYAGVWQIEGIKQ
ncbi:MAG: hypothetical protein GTN62_05640 [Gemmatimonadales bacterium]|nr:hypothetical protein [Gemmatimonadales bacterium]NIN10986.1 hypothetical protein [Gemmatimonadales bacterium]NIN49578.1 hypothetical protein [Gemmatimonadales bacterium]NIP07042.1 hypothetical protein [Gemmatimonadales bacterium]NIR01677.1 hypothetical protein [Gemmatimonadales bacterium]